MISDTLHINGGLIEKPDEVLLNVPDDYFALPHKCKAMFQWALNEGYDYVLKCDDDVYIQPDRLLKSDFKHDYVRRLSKSNNGIPKEPYASGFAYWVSSKSMKILTEAEITDWAEDRWTGRTLKTAGIELHQDDDFVMIDTRNSENLPLLETLWNNKIIVACELSPSKMMQVHKQWTESIILNSSNI